jgi:hypothetical protein
MNYVKTTAICLLIAAGAATASDATAKPKMATDDYLYGKRETANTTDSSQPQTKSSWLITKLPSWDDVKNSQVTTCAGSFLTAAAFGTYMHHYHALPAGRGKTAPVVCPRAFNCALGSIPVAVALHRYGKAHFLKSVIIDTAVTALSFGVATQVINS